MVYRLPNLVWLRAFEAAARLGSFTAAAGELGLTQAAVSHQVRSLEDKLGFRLFLRQARRLDLTDMGKAYLPSVSKAMEDLSLSTQGLFGPRGRRTVTLRAPISTAVLWLSPRLRKFREQHPHIQFRMISAIWADAIADEDVDIDIRLGTGAWPAMQAELLSPETIVPICAPTARICSLSDISEARIIHIIGFQDDWARLFQRNGARYDPAKIGIAVDTTLAAVELVSCDAGVALVLKRFAVDLVRAGKAAVPLDEEIAIPQAHYIVSDPGRTAVNPEVEIVRRWLRDEFTQQECPA
ncbi:MAG TPA: LysR substrate-binding domain-containing protein [Thermohalobaculum sp.]|nr:LysR substrate-binding domain-containing protein [Thermohalobaculum sp.]